MKNNPYVNFHIWCKKARWKEEVEYYRGFLMNDRKGNLYLSDCADSALSQCEKGYLLLFQLKIAPGVYSYIARRSRKR